MHNGTVSGDRVILNYPAAFRFDATPYRSSNFQARVRQVCTDGASFLDEKLLVKVVVVGDASVGKTSLVQRFCHSTFNRDYKATIGVDFEVEKLSILGRHLRLQIWDTAGQERFRAISAAYYRGAHVVLSVMDLDLAAQPGGMQLQLDRVAMWMEEACGIYNGGTPLRFLVATKRDLLSTVSYESMAAQLIAGADHLSAELCVVSAKTGEEVQSLFFRLAVLAFEEEILRNIRGNSNPERPLALAGEAALSLTAPSGSTSKEKKNAAEFCGSTCS